MTMSMRRSELLPEVAELLASDEEFRGAIMRFFAARGGSGHPRERRHGRRACRTNRHAGPAPSKSAAPISADTPRGCRPEWRR
jgi:hypothetical protein